MCLIDHALQEFRHTVACPENRSWRPLRKLIVWTSPYTWAGLKAVTHMASKFLQFEGITIWTACSFVGVLYMGRFLSNGWATRLSARDPADRGTESKKESPSQGFCLFCLPQ